MTTITINGKVLTVLEKEYEDKKTMYVQFMAESESRGLEVLKVKVTKDEDITKIQKDMFVSIPVSISSVNGNLYYSQSDLIRYQKDVK